MGSPENRNLAMYWGRRGGGESLFSQVLEMCESTNFSVLQSKRPTYVKLDGSISPVSFLHFTKWILARRHLLDITETARVRTVLIVMSSPWDLFLGKKLIDRGVEVVRIIHDATPHPGEKFPPRFWIKWLIRDSSRVITLSQYVSDQIDINYGVTQTPVCVTPFPIPYIERKVKTAPSKSNKILLIGRGKKYQGQELLEEAWKLVEIPSAQLVIAGEGFRQNQTLLGVTYKSKWMTNQELIDEVATSKLVVLPYLEASQSGTIPICNALGVPVVITPVGGLVEQVRHGENGVISTEVSAKALAVAIEIAWHFEWNTKYSSSEFSRERFLRDCFSLK